MKDKPLKDFIAEALAEIHGGIEKANELISPFEAIDATTGELVKVFARAAPSVIDLDHVTKAFELTEKNKHSITANTEKMLAAHTQVHSSTIPIRFEISVDAAKMTVVEGNIDVSGNLFALKGGAKGSGKRDKSGRLLQKIAFEIPFVMASDPADPSS